MTSLSTEKAAAPSDPRPRRAMHATRSSYSARGGSSSASPASSASSGGSSARFGARTDENRVPTYMRPTSASSRAAASRASGDVVMKETPTSSTARSRIAAGYGSGASASGRLGLREQTPNGTTGGLSRAGREPTATTTAASAASRARLNAAGAGSSASRFSYRSTGTTTNASGTRSAAASNGTGSFRTTPSGATPTYSSYAGTARGAAATTVRGATATTARGTSTTAARTPFTSTLRPRPTPYSSSRLASAASSTRTSQESSRSDEDMEVDEEGSTPPPAPQQLSHQQIRHQPTQSQPQPQSQTLQQQTQQQQVTQHQPNKVWTIDDFEFGREIGKGKFGKVYVARERGTRVKVAIKVLIKDVLRAEGVAHQLKKEVEIHSRIRHPNILPLYATFQDSTRVFLVMKYAGGGDLYKKLQSTARHRFPEREAMQYVAQLVSALEACHQQHVVHRDLKPENLLLAEDGSLQLGDFGWSSANVTPANRRETLCGTLDYLSPEMICGEKYDESVDIWAVGIIMYEMLVGKPPFEAPGQGETMDRITNDPVSVPSYVSPAATDLIIKILRKRPEDRIKLPEIKAHPWFSPPSTTRQRSARRAL